MTFDEILTQVIDLLKHQGRVSYWSWRTRWRVARACQAETCFQQALAVARHQHAKSWELRAAMSLASLWQSQGKRQDAYNLLAPVYNWFTEGFDTADLKDAKSLLDELSTAKGVSRWPE